jgi:hypothetical protein
MGIAHGVLCDKVSLELWKNSGRKDEDNKDVLESCESEGRGE